MGSEKRATREAFGEFLVDRGAKDPNFVVLEADLGRSTRTAKFGKQFPERYFNLGIAESNMVGVAAGLASCGKTVVISGFAVFTSGRAWDQIRVSLGYAQSNVKVCVTHSGLSVGEDGPTHHAISDIALMRSIPGITVVQPCDDVETVQCLNEVSNRPGPFYVRLGRMPVERVHKADYRFNLGDLDVLRPGEDIAILATGIGVQMALAAASKLSARGISALVGNVHTIKPLPGRQITDIARRVGRVVTIEDHSVVGGLGEAVSTVLAEEASDARIRLIGSPDAYAESAPARILLDNAGVSTDAVIRAADSLLSDEQKK
jgi:transketolase